VQEQTQSQASEIASLNTFLPATTPVVLEGRVYFGTPITTELMEFGFHESYGGYNNFVIFSSVNDLGHMYAVVRVGGTFLGQVELPSSIFDSWHLYKIVWGPTNALFYLDDVLQATILTTGLTTPLHIRMIKSHNGTDGDAAPYYVDWVRLTPYASSSGTFESAVLDGGGGGTRWSELIWNGDEPSGTTVAFETRTGETSDPEDPGWSAWSAVAGGAVTSPYGRYVQYRATLTIGARPARESGDR